MILLGYILVTIPLIGIVYIMGRFCDSGQVPLGPSIDCPLNISDGQGGTSSSNDLSAFLCKQQNLSIYNVVLSLFSSMNVSRRMVSKRNRI